MNGEINYRDRFLYEAVNMFISVVEMGTLIRGCGGIDSFLEPASSGTAVFPVVVIFQSRRSLLALKSGKLLFSSERKE